MAKLDALSHARTLTAHNHVIKAGLVAPLLDELAAYRTAAAALANEGETPLAAVQRQSAAAVEAKAQSLGRSEHVQGAPA